MNPIVYIKVPTHIRQWAYRAYGDPVVFPAIGNEVAVLRKFTSRPPVVNLSPIDQENIREMQQADASQLHQSVKHTFHDEEFEQSRWLTHPEEYLAIELPDSKAKPVREYNYLAACQTCRQRDDFRPLQDGSLGFAQRHRRPLMQTFIAHFCMVRTAWHWHRLRGYRTPMFLQNA